MTTDSKTELPKRRMKSNLSSMDEKFSSVHEMGRKVCSGALISSLDLKADSTIHTNGKKVTRPRMARTAVRMTEAMRVRMIYPSSEFFRPAENRKEMSV